MLSQDIHNLPDKASRNLEAGRTDGEMLCDSRQKMIQNDPGCMVSVIEDNGDVSIIFFTNNTHEADVKCSWHHVVCRWYVVC